MQVKQFLGIEDVILGSKNHTTSAYCEQQAEVMAISKQDFIKLQATSFVWQCLTERVSSKVDMLKKTIIVNKEAKSRLDESVKTSKVETKSKVQSGGLCLLEQNLLEVESQLSLASKIS